MDGCFFLFHRARVQFFSFVVVRVCVCVCEIRRMQLLLFCLFVTMFIFRLLFACKVCRMYVIMLITGINHFHYYTHYQHIIRECINLTFLKLKLQIFVRKVSDYYSAVSAASRSCDSHVISRTTHLTLPLQNHPHRSQYQTPQTQS